MSSGQPQTGMMVPNQRPNTVLDNINAAMPAFMQEHSGEGTQDLGQFIRPPRMKVVQNQSLGVFRESYLPGDVLLMPDFIHIASHVRATRDQPAQPATLWFTPLLFYVEWIHTKPNSGNPAEFLQGRTLDPNHEIAIKSRNSATREYRVGEQKFMYLEVLNFVVLLHGVGVDGMPVVMSFMSAEHRSGETFAAKIRMRKINGSQAPIYGCVFQGTLADRTNAKGAWYGWDIDNPTPASGVPAWVTDPDVYAAYRARHLELVEALQQRMLVTDYDDGSGENSATGGSNPDPNAPYGTTVEGQVVGQPAY